MSKVKIQGNSSGTGVLTVTAPNTSTDRTITLPDSTGTILDSTSTTNDGKLLTAGSTAGSISWEDAPVSLPTQSDPATVDKYLQSDGTDASWATVDTDSNTTTKGLYEHEHTIDADYSISSGNNALSASPITISSGKSVTVPSGSTWVIV